jgi:hypothetical protein
MMAGMNVWMKCGKVMDLLQGATTTVTGDWKYKDSGTSTYQAILSGTGTISATVIIEVSNDGINASNTPLGTIVLSGTTITSDGFTSSAPWKYVRARISAISGTSATINVNTGV